MPVASRDRAIGGLRVLGGLALASLLSAPGAHAGAPRTHEPIGFQLFESPQVDPIVLSANGSELYVAHTTANAVQVFDANTGAYLRRVPVGMEPVALALRPGSHELWVSNHVSDTVSIVDIDPASDARWRVVDTIQAIDAAGVTRFDEPAGIAFTANGAKAYVALSSRDAIAVINAATRTVTGSIKVRAQEPRAIAVRNGRLYVAAFESGNRSELSACPTGFPPFMSGSAPQCTLGALDLLDFATNPNLPGLTKNIVIDPQVPDRDLFVYDTATDTQLSVVSGIGTLLYGLTVSSAGRVFITQTDARNAVNGLEGENLVDLDNRMFFNEVAAVTCNPSCGPVTVRDLEPANPTHATAMATPYGIALSGDETTLVITLAGSSRVATLNAATLATLGVVDLGAAAEFGRQIPKGVTLRSGPGGVPQTAYVLNSMENTVSIVDISNPASPVHTGKIQMFGDPVPEDLRRGRIAFNNAFASSTGTFSCGSCHPDAHVDQILWRIGGACFFGACTGDDEPRTTMPIRGLKNTLPLHWDGTLGDPFGGPDGAVGNAGNLPPSCDLGGPGGDLDCFRHLVDGSLSGVMCAQAGGCATGPSGLPGPLDDTERDDMALFLGSVSYPPARSRRIDDTISTAASPVPVPNGSGQPSSLQANALTGFQDFFTNQGGQVANPNTCADSDAGCHTLPLGASTNSQTLQGFDVPTMRGMTDRFVQFSIGITAAEESLVLANSGVGLLGVSGMETPIRWNANDGFREITTFGAAFLLFQPAYNTRPLHTFQMFEEASTGFSGAQGRQVQLNQRTTGGGLLSETETHLAALELADSRGLVNLRGDGLRSGAPITLSFRNDGLYKTGNNAVSLTRAQLITEAQDGTLVLTLTAHLRSNWGAAVGAQPLLAPVGTGSNGVTGDPPLPVIAAGSAGNPPPITLVGTSVRPNAAIFLDGQPATGTLSCSVEPSTGFCSNGNLSIDLNQGVALGLRLLQVQNPAGALSNEMPICVGNAGNCN